MRITRRVGLTFTAISAFALAAGTAQATPQFLPLSADTRVHTLSSGGQGVSWNTGDPGVVGGQVEYISGSLVITGGIDAINYYDPNIVGCPTDSGSNCTLNYSPNLDFTVLAQFIGATLTPTGGGQTDIVLDFQSAGGTDITWTDPGDGNSVMLEASWTAGTFLGNPTPGLQVVATYCDGVGGCGPAGLMGDPLAVGFALINNSTPYASLFDADGNPFTQNSIMLNFSELFGFVPDINSIAASLVANSTLPDFSGEGQGELFRLETGDFVIPEPSTALLLGLGLAGIGALRRRTER